MNTLTNTTTFDILFRRQLPKIGDLAMALRAMELTRLANPHLSIALQCTNPLLLKDHPALDGVFSWEEEPTGKLTIELTGIFQKHNEPKHKTFCDVTSEQLSAGGLIPIKWDGAPQNLWVSLSNRYWAKSIVNNYTRHGKRVIGVFWRSDQNIRTWEGIKNLVTSLSLLGKYVLFCFDASESLPVNKNIVNVAGFSLDRVVALVSCMDMVLTTDTGGMHIAGGLGIPIFGFFGATDPEIIAGMYSDVFHFKPQCRYSPCWFERKCLRKRCMEDIQEDRILSFVEKFLSARKVIPELWGLPSTETAESSESCLMARIRGIGDVGMSLFGLEQFKKDNPSTHVTYLTNTASAALFCGQEGLVDNVMVKDYNHHTREGFVPLPSDIDIDSYDKIINMMNAVDFGEIAHKKNRAENFADLMGVTLKDSPLVRPLVVTEEEKAWARDRIDYNEGEIIIVCQLDSKGRSRYWPVGHWLKFSSLLYNLYGRRVKLVFLSVREEHRNIEVRERRSNIYNLACETNVREYIAMAAISDFLICSDSSGLHIGGRIPTTKVIGLFGSTGVADDNKWAHTRYYNNIYPIQSDMSCSPCWDWQRGNCVGNRHCPVCMWKIKPEGVLHEIVRLLEGVHIDSAIKSCIPCPSCGTVMKHIDGHYLTCLSCRYSKGHFDHMHFMTENIAVGNATAPQDGELLSLSQIGAIITVACDFDHTSQILLPHYRFNLHDSTNNDFVVFLEAVEQLRACVEEHNRTLIHCMGGGRRSVAVAAWYLSNGKREEFWRIIKEFKKVRFAVKLEGGIHDFLDSHLL